tara:strand:+ start:2373 stop:3224 length:852 start_codon:yes stop_codon:yes gene_type:complete
MYTKTKLKQHIKDLNWRYNENLIPTIKYKLQKLKKRKIADAVKNEIKRIVSEVNENGYSFSSIDDLNIYNFQKDIEPLRFYKSKNHSRFYEQTLLSIKNNNKTSYQIDILKDASSDVRDPAVRIIKNPIFKIISEEYYKMLTKFWEYSSMLTFPSTENPKMSQLWHRDPEDILILKHFIFLEDIEIDNGPIFYAPGTHHLGNIKKTPKSFIENKAPRVKDEDMEKIVPRDKWVSAIGKRGTIFFADTRGYHKGGYLKKNSRWIMQGQYISPSAHVKQKIINFK